MFESDDEKMSRLKRVFTTVVEMLNDRGYRLSEFESISSDQFVEYYCGNNSKGDLWMTKRGNLSHKILVSFTKALGTQAVRETLAQMEKYGVDTVIFVVQQRVTALARTLCASSVNVHFEIFMETELMFNVTKHKLVPVHELLTDDEKKALLLKYTLKVSQLPRIQVNDPIAKYYGIRPGQVMKITRLSETAGNYINYRLAV